LSRVSCSQDVHFRCAISHGSLKEKSHESYHIQLISLNPGFKSLVIGNTS
jgi:hypothetical protein